MPRVSHIVLDSSAGYAVQVRAGHHHLVGDEPTSRGGTDTGPAPYDLLLSALAACTAITLRMYADRKRWTLGAIRVDVEIATGTDGVQQIRRSISFGEPLDEGQRSKLAEIADKTPVTKTLRAGVAIATDIARPKGSESGSGAAAKGP